MRVEVHHQADPGKRVLVALREDATLDELRDAVEARIGVRPEVLCLGESQAQIVSVADIRDGDSVRIVSPPLAPQRDGAQATAEVDQPDRREVSPWYNVVRVILTLAIFVLLEDHTIL
ncbi:hypothetical protein AB1Y20_015983 [Prymnesium parvum]|uniref:Ubiquitin-like domain-containing protein n=1 Tax=Prymnesium parvum TaxID=97485 RepID=A0AB34K313_PRYPA